jgi:hypothetical protein
VGGSPLRLSKEAAIEMEAGPQRKIPRRTASALTAVASLVLSLLVCEVAVRYVGEFDALGQFVFRGRVVRPYELPLETVRQSLDAYRSSTESRLVYDSLLGWAPRPGAVSADGLYRYNSRGLRSEPREFEHLPRPGVLRVELFGDSFVHGDDVAYEETFSAQLEGHLRGEGVRAEVMNFGVSGYGIDQALLHFRRDGSTESAQLVVLGFQAENVNRNLNILRPLYIPQTSLPFAKPRFVVEGGELRLVNVPVLSFEEIPATLEDLESWELIDYEHFYDPGDYHDPLWRRSKFLAATVDELQRALGAAPAEAWRPILDDESMGLTTAIIDAFRRQAEEAGAHFLVVHLPARSDLETLLAGEPLAYRALLRQLDERFEVVHPERLMMRVARDDSIDALFVPGPMKGHYSAFANKLIADALFDEVAREITAGRLQYREPEDAPRPPRGPGRPGTTSIWPRVGLPITRAGSPLPLVESSTLCAPDPATVGAPGEANGTTGGVVLDAQAVRVAQGAGA